MRSCCRQEEVRRSGAHALDSPEWPGKLCRRIWWEVEVGVLLAHADLVLPGRPASSPGQPMRTPQQLLLQRIVLSLAARPPPPTPEMGPSGPGLSGRSHRGIWSVPDQDTPKVPEWPAILGAAPEFWGPTWAGTGCRAPHWQGCGCSRTLQVQLPPAPPPAHGWGRFSPG